MLHVGVLVNPIAGVGGKVALKGSDGVAIQKRAFAAGGEARGGERLLRMLDSLGVAAQEYRWSTWGGVMGENWFALAGIKATVIGKPDVPSTSADTRQAALELRASGVDLLIFAGGDGTARDILEAIGDSLPVLGIPAGVKMHSGVFATTPSVAADVVQRLRSGGLVSSTLREVCDIDEAALRMGEVKPRSYGELRVPEAGGFVQHTKVAGRENELLAVEEIVADIVERLAGEKDPVVLGPGSTLSAIKRALGMKATLLGVDVWLGGDQLGRDVSGEWLENNVRSPILILSFTRAQGFLIGRGNQQLTPAFLRQVDKSRIWVVGTRSKLKSLAGRPLLLDTNDAQLDESLTGMIEVIAGYEDRLWYRTDCRA